MRRLSILFLIIVFTIIGCAGIQFTRTEQDVVAKISARHIGDELMKQYPEVALQVADIAKIALAKNDITAMDSISNLLLTQVKDPLLRLDIRDLLSLIEVKVEIPEKQATIIKDILQGLIQGIEACQ